ncbi:DUF916 and DUF3324 domain-containing protein [Enterococcus ratti]|nr:DUF916 and DUF3324 domain-containing protein [Enterococcus ratti]
MIKKVIYSILLSFIFAITGTVSVQANEMLGGYTIERVPNKHQIDSNLGYFYLFEQAGTQDRLGVKLVNSSNQAKVLKVKVTNANTNSNGLLDYTGSLKDHKDLKQPLSSIVKAAQTEVTVPAKSTIETTLTVSMPKEKFSGVIVGGIVVSEKSNEEKNKQKEEVSIQNTYNYTLGVVLTNDAKTVMNQHVSVTLDKVAPILSDGKKIVQADILNPNSYIFDKATVSGDIRKKDSDKVLKKQEKTDVSIAPHSVYPFQFDWGKDELTPGEYLFTGSVKAGGKEWFFNRVFKITADSAKEINEQSIYYVVIPLWLRISWIVVLLINIVGTGYLVIKRVKKINKEKI